MLSSASNQSDILDYNIINDGKLINLMQSSSIIYPDLQNRMDESGKYTLIDFYYHDSDQLVKLYFLEKNHGIE